MTGDIHPARVKLELALRGVRIGESARAALVGAGGAPALLELGLGSDIRVTVPAANDPREASWTLEEDGGRFLVRSGVEGDAAASRIVVDVRPSPRFYARRTSAGVPMWRAARVLGRHLVVTPREACGFSVRGMPCPFCLEGARGSTQNDGLVSVADVVEVVRAAFEEGAADSVCFNSAVFDGEDGGITFLAPYIEAVRMHFDTLVAAQVHPPRTPRWVDSTYALGVDAVSYNLELFGRDSLTRHCVGRSRYIGRDRYLEALGRAAEIFPRGTVWTDLVLGLESPETTTEGIETLARLGVVPVLVPPRPPQPGLEPEAIVPVLVRLYRAVKEQRINMGWVRDLAVGITPLEARHFAGDDARLAVAIDRLTRWRVGALAARSLARVRRRLRVRPAHEAAAVHG